MGKENKSSDDDEKPPVAKNAIELQRFKLAKLMKNPDKPVVIPDRLKEKKMPHVPEFVRNVMGSSAGAGSGEFHVYRHLRRKEYARQKFIQEKSEKQLLEEAYHQKIIENNQAAEEKTAKKRAKRLKNKAKKKMKKQNLKNNPVDKSITAEEVNTSESDSESEVDKEQMNTESEVDKEQLNTESEADKEQLNIESEVDNGQVNTESEVDNS